MRRLRQVESLRQFELGLKFGILFDQALLVRCPTLDLGRYRHKGEPFPLLRFPTQGAGGLLEGVQQTSSTLRVQQAHGQRIGHPRDARPRP